MSCCREVPVCTRPLSPLDPPQVHPLGPALQGWGEVGGEQVGEPVA